MARPIDHINGIAEGNHLETDERSCSGTRYVGQKVAKGR